MWECRIAVRNYTGPSFLVGFSSFLISPPQWVKKSCFGNDKMGRKEGRVNVNGRLNDAEQCAWKRKKRKAGKKKRRKERRREEKENEGCTCWSFGERHTRRKERRRRSKKRVGCDAQTQSFPFTFPLFYSTEKRLSLLILSFLFMFLFLFLFFFFSFFFFLKKLRKKLCQSWKAEFFFFHFVFSFHSALSFTSFSFTRWFLLTVHLIPPQIRIIHWLQSLHNHMLFSFFI